MKLLLSPPLSSSPRISLFFTWTWIIGSCKIQITHNQGMPINHIWFSVHFVKNKPWYQRAIEMGSLWRSISNNSKSTQVPAAASSTLLKTIVNVKSASSSSSNNIRHANKLRKCTSLKVATSFTRLPPRRSNSYPRTRPYSKPLGTATMSARQLSTDQGIRRVFRGNSLTDDEAMMQVRRRTQMEVIRRRSVMRRKRLGPSPLCRMAVAQVREEV
ncbi:unnamed protein product [Malus baccata var. baccata]